MKRTKVDSSQERQFIIAMIMSQDFLAQINAILDLDLIEEIHFKQVADWCIKFYQEYRRAPGKDIEGIYQAWASKKERDEDTVEAVHDFLESLSEEYDTAGDINTPFLLDSFSVYLRRGRLVKLKDDIDYTLLEGDLDAAEASILAHKSIPIDKGFGVDTLNEEEPWERAFDKPMEPLISFPGDAGKFFNEALVRDGLIAIQAPEKRGKTWWCIELAIRALRGRKKVAMFEVGDLSEGQTLLRFGVRFSGRPLRKSQCGVVKIPKTMAVRAELDGTEWAEVRENIYMKIEERTCEKPITKGACIKATKKFMKRCRLPEDRTYLMLSTHANSSININQIDGILERWRIEKDFIPDVIIIDYADILAPEDAGKDARHQVNDTWKAMRRLSQERHCLVITATQADAGSYSADTQSMQNFSEDKRKLAHVTGMFGLNQTNEEKEMQIMRLNWLVLRESEYSSGRCLHVGQCLTLGKAFCCGRS